MANMLSSHLINLTAMGFCGADDSIDPKILQLMSTHYPWVEWGVLFRPDLEGRPRYPTSKWVNELSNLAIHGEMPMKLAAHLCGSRCQAILNGDYNFVLELRRMGFRRVQLNITAANNVQIDDTKIETYVHNIRSCIESVPQVEWIMQYNNETKVIWNSLLNSPPSNISVLQDPSCGLGVTITEFPKPFEGIHCGYAGGIGPANISDILSSVAVASEGKPVWIDMESSVRSKVVADKGLPEKDIFDINKCFACIRTAVDS